MLQKNASLSNSHPLSAQDALSKNREHAGFSPVLWHRNALEMNVHWPPASHSVWLKKSSHPLTRQFSLAKSQVQLGSLKHD